MGSIQQNVQVIVKTPERVEKHLAPVFKHVNAAMRLEGQPDNFYQMVKEHSPVPQIAKMFNDKEYWDQWWKQNLNNAKRFIEFVPHAAVMMVGLLKDDEVPFGAKLSLVLAILYIVSPVDLIPDPIIVLGLIDDSMFTVLAITHFLKAIGRVEDKEKFLSKYWNGDQQSAAFMLNLMETSNVLDRYAILDLAAGAGYFRVLGKLVFSHMRQLMKPLSGFFK